MLERMDNQELQTTGRLKEIEVEVKFLGEQTARNFIEMGRLLSEAKERIFGNETERRKYINSLSNEERKNVLTFNDWVEKNCLIARSTADRLIRINNKFSNVELNAPARLAPITFFGEMLSLDDNQAKEVLTEDHLIGDKIKKATELSKEELRQVVNEKKLLQKALEEKEKAIADMKTEVENAKKRSSEEVIKASEKAREMEKRNAMRLLEQWKLDNEKEAKEKQIILIQEQKKVLAEKKKLEEEKEKLMKSEAEFKGKEKRLLLIEDQLLKTTEEISKLSQDKEEVLKDIQHLKDIGEFYEETKKYVSKLVNVTHNPVYYKYLGEKEVSENLREVIKVLLDNALEIEKKFNNSNEIVVEFVEV